MTTEAEKLTTAEMISIFRLKFAFQSLPDSLYVSIDEDNGTIDIWKRDGRGIANSVDSLICEHAVTL